MKRNNEINTLKIIFIILLLMGFITILLSNNNCKYNKIDKHNTETNSINSEVYNDNVEILNTESTEENIVETEKELANIYIISNIECILQNPELPTGCEVTSLCIVLKYLGFNIDKCDLSDNYLPKCKIGTDTPYNAFLGNPRDPHSYGCYSPVIVSCCNDYFSQNGIYNYEAIDISGLEFEELFEYVCNDTPVIVWGTMYMGEPYESTTWNINGSNFTWKANEHCMVLYGFNLEENIVYISDPLVGNTVYDLYTFKDRYNQMYKQAVIIEKVE